MIIKWYDSIIIYYILLLLKTMYIIETHKSLSILHIGF